MTGTLTLWAAAWGIAPDAVADLQRRLDLGGMPSKGKLIATTEADVATMVRLEATAKGVRLWRNNVGAARDARTARLVRYGLANDSQALNAALKSADLIGIRPVLIQPEHAGRTIGQFVSRECKAPGWAMPATPSERERAQAAWALLIDSMGGDAGFCTGEGTL